MKYAVVGCAHGELEVIYEKIANIENYNKIKIDFLLVCGDFQATRNTADLLTMSAPKLYQNMCSFHKYYNGELTAPLLTIFVGGDHEASNHLQELPYGGWVAPKIYYLGYAGVVRVNGLRIAGLSGIYKRYDYRRGHYEFAPYNDITIRSVFHVRELEVFRLKQLSGRIDIFISHDWPGGITNYGNAFDLMKSKPNYVKDVCRGEFGSRPAMELLKSLRPLKWFAAHFHVKFAATVRHPPYNHATEFLALDKCSPGRPFLEVFDIDAPECPEPWENGMCFEYDLEWLAILRLTNHMTNVGIAQCPVPILNRNHSWQRYNFTPTTAEREYISKKLHNNLHIPANFVHIMPYVVYPNLTPNLPQPPSLINPQTKLFCNNLDLDDPLLLALLQSGCQPIYAAITGQKEMEFMNSICSSRVFQPNMMDRYQTRGLPRAAFPFWQPLHNSNASRRMEDGRSQMYPPHDGATDMSNMPRKENGSNIMNKRQQN